MNSIAMCTYNGEKYIRQQLESLIGQTLPPDEIVICDDCSKDRTVHVVRDTLKDWDGHWQLVCNEKNLGFKKNFEKAISLCRGDIIYLSDQDDVWDPRKIETMDEAFRAHPEAVTVWHDAELVDGELRPLYPSFWKDTLRFDHQKFLRGDYAHVMEINAMQGSACAFRREVFAAAKPFPAEAIHDEWLLLISLLQGPVIPLPRVLMKYRQADNTLGGMPMTIGEKIKRGLAWRDYAEFLTKELRRRKKIFQELLSRDLPVKRPDVWALYEENARFLTYRLQSIEKGNPGLCLHFSDYQKLTRDAKVPVAMIKDYICVLERIKRSIISGE